MDTGTVLALPEGKSQTTLYVKLKETHGCAFLGYEAPPTKKRVQFPSAVASGSGLSPW